MRRDTQIGIILGIVILVIIGVFLSTRTSDNKAVLPELVLSEGERQKPETDEIDINGFFKESKNVESKEAHAVEYATDKTVVSEEPVMPAEPIKPAEPVATPETVNVEPLQDDSSMEAKWEGVAEEIVEESEITEQPVTIDEIEVAKETPSTKDTVIQEEEPQEPSYKAPEDIHYKVQSNDTLFKIASKHYGDGNKWHKIFEANRENMPDPNALYVGQELLIPDVTGLKETDEATVTAVSGELDSRDFSNANTHTVEAGDTLYRIAEKYYDDPGVWIKIYEANEDRIEDKSLLREGQILIIPDL